jgi:hypothetical protein
MKAAGGVLVAVLIFAVAIGQAQPPAKVVTLVRQH